MKGGSISLAIKQMQIKTPMRCRFTSLTKARKEEKGTMQVLAKMWTGGSTLTLLVGMFNGAATVETVCLFSKS